MHSHPLRRRCRLRLARVRARERKPRPRTARRVAALIPARLRPPLDLAARIEAAGSPGGLGPGEVMAVKAATALLAAPLGTAFGTAAPGRLGLLLALGAPVAGFLAPDYYLARRTRERVRATRRDLPALLDLLRVAVDAGLAESRRSGRRRALRLAAGGRMGGRGGSGSARDPAG